MNQYRLKKERERVLKSAVIVLSTSTLVFAILWIIGLLKFEDFNNYSGPVKITFGIEDGVEDLDVPVNKLPVKKEEPEPEPEPIEPVEEKDPVVEKEPDPIPEEKIEPKKEPKKPEEVKKHEPKEVKEPEPPKPRIQKGTESGNSHETTFESSSSDIGRSAYIPISLYMPLPKSISKDIFANIRGDVTGFDEEGYNRSYFLEFYRDNGEEFVLDYSIPYNDRPYIWTIIENAGYNLSNADYKKDKNLKPVIILFEIKGSSSGNSAIKSAVVDSSSGDNEIDEAVLYGFKRSTYSNATDDDVKGRFKYDFK